MPVFVPCAGCGISGSAVFGEFALFREDSGGSLTLTRWTYATEVKSADTATLTGTPASAFRSNNHAFFWDGGTLNKITLATSAVAAATGWQFVSSSAGGFSAGFYNSLCGGVSSGSGSNLNETGYYDYATDFAGRANSSGLIGTVRGAGSFPNHVIVAGGFDAGNDGSILADYYDTRTGVRIIANTLTTKRGSMYNAITDFKRAAFIGGTPSSFPAGTAVADAGSEIFTESTLTWSAGPGIGAQLFHAITCSGQNYGVAMGGASGQNLPVVYDTIRKFNFQNFTIAAATVSTTNGAGRVGV